jgi:hypothetical protein
MADSNASGVLSGTPLAATFTIVTGRSWDDDCDGIVDCFRDHDRDSFGTFVRRLAASETTTLDTSCGGAIPADGCIDRVGIDDFFECDNTTLRWAGRGAPTGEFDCHDDSPAADPTGVQAESNDDAYDNDCNGFVTCFADRDNDEFSVAAGDCDDTNGWVHPGANEVRDGLDNDCDGVVDNIAVEGPCPDGSQPTSGCNGNKCAGEGGCSTGSSTGNQRGALVLFALAAAGLRRRRANRARARRGGTPRRRPASRSRREDRARCAP